MWTRSELKNMAKTNLHNKYWIAFLISLLTALLGGGTGIVSFNFNSGDLQMRNMNWNRMMEGDFSEFGNWINSWLDSEHFWQNLLPIIIGALFLALLSFLIALAFQLFVSAVVEAGSCRWFSRSRESTATPTIVQLFHLFKSPHYLKTVGSMAWMKLFLFLWGLLASLPPLVLSGIFFRMFINLPGLGLRWDTPEMVLESMSRLYGELLPVAALSLLLAVLFNIPLLIKTYSYRMTPWILGDNSQIGFKRALKLSMDLTRGHKWKMFVLDLSFIGWFILGGLACGVGVLFVLPYYQAVQAELYAQLRQNGVSGGLCTMEELGFIRVEPAGSSNVQPDANPL
ncbi:MAG TPA: hypothetical protein DD640_06950 [Clostridiales bacterium]|nr:hypothetical protein [Clostridiales bacterium]